MDLIIYLYILPTIYLVLFKSTDVQSQQYHKKKSSKV